MKLTQLTYLSAVIEEGSFSAAARRCAVAQPTISNAIGQLEEELGAKLLARTTRRVELTPFGRHVLPLAQSVLTAVDELHAEVERFKNPDQKLVRIGFSSALDMPRLMRTLEPFCAQHADVELIFKECTAEDMETRLIEEKLDVVCWVSEGKQQARNRCALYEDPLRFLPRGGAEGRLLGNSIDLSEVVKERLLLTAGTCGLRAATLTFLERAGLRPDLYPGQAISYPVLVEWTELGIGGAILPESKINTDVDRYPLVTTEGQIAMLRFEAIWRKDAVITPHHRALVHYLKTAAPALLKGALPSR